MIELIAPELDWFQVCLLAHTTHFPILPNTRQKELLSGRKVFTRKERRQEEEAWWPAGSEKV